MQLKLLRKFALLLLHTQYKADRTYPVVIHFHTSGLGLTPKPIISLGRSGVNQSFMQDHKQSAIFCSHFRRSSPPQPSRPHCSAEQCSQPDTQGVPDRHEGGRRLWTSQRVASRTNGPSQQPAGKTGSLRLRRGQALHGPQDSHQRRQRKPQ